MKGVLRVAFYVLLTLGGLYLLWRFQAMLIAVILSVMISASTRPVIAGLVSRTGWPASVARVLVYLIVPLAILVPLSLLSGRLLDELNVLANAVGLAYEVNYLAWQETTPFAGLLVSRIPEPAIFYDALFNVERGAPAWQGLLGLGQSALTLGGNLIIVVILSLYWSVDQARFERLWLSLLPASERVQARSAWRVVEQAMGAYLRQGLTRMLLGGLLLGIGFVGLGLPFPILLALVGALAQLLPFVGVIVIGGLAFSAGLNASLLLGLVALGYTLLVTALLTRVIERVLFQRTESYVLIVLFMVPLADALGLVGLALAPPLAVAAQSLAGHLVVQRRAMGNGQVHLDSVAARYDRMVKSLTADGQQPTPEIANLLQRLDGLLARARQTS